MNTTLTTKIQKGLNMITLSKRILVSTVLTFSFLFSAHASSNISGKWRSTHGIMTIHQSGSNIHGSYGSSTFEGVLNGKVLTGTYLYLGKHKGHFKLTFDSNFNSFKGNYKRGSGAGKWDGERISSGNSNEGTSGSSDNNSSTATQSDILRLSGNWKVEDATNGINQDYSNTLWTFDNFGNVHAGNLWRGLWERTGNQSIRVILIDRSANIDHFDITFTNNDNEFLAEKNGSPYRHGVKAN